VTKIKDYIPISPFLEHQIVLAQKTRQCPMPAATKFKGRRYESLRAHLKTGINREARGRSRATTYPTLPLTVMTIGLGWAIVTIQNRCRRTRIDIASNIDLGRGILRTVRYGTHFSLPIR
jgi:hypothetical protein